MKKLVPEYVFSEEQLNIISSLAAQTGYSEAITRILYARGVDTEEKIRRFMRPSKKNFLDPFLMRGMKETVELLTQARDEGKVVAVFGDYDADGVCASAIMFHALRAFGIEPHVYIPERADGYGLSMETIDRIFDECNPELFITVDCGISCAEEAQYIYELGSDVIVTDHHELPERLPDCIIVNPKLDDDYPYDNLCGAGVAFKVACALLGEAAFAYLDFAALATVADSVPLLGENRDIVTEGLKLFNTKLRPCFAGLLGKTYEAISAQTLSFTVAPRVNAAGRMGDAYAAFRLFIAQKDTEIYELSTKLCAYNIERQKCCDDLYESAKQKLKEKGAFGNVIMLSDESWNAGFIGIVAARLAEEFKRPTLLFVHNGNLLKGSARSIENINIFQCLRACGHLIEEFGGHAQAAGINVKPELFETLEKALNEEIEKTYSSEDFEQKIYYSEEITTPISEQFAHELMMIEPCGVGHRRPLFYISANKCQVKTLKFGSQHISVRNELMDLTYFSGLKHVKILKSDVQKQLVFEVAVSHFKGREYIKGSIRDILYDGKTGISVSESIFANTVQKCYAKQTQVETAQFTTQDLQALIDEKKKQCDYGLCLIASDRKTLRHYENLEGFGCDLFEFSSKNVANTLIVAPTYEVDFSGFRDIVFLDTPLDFNFASLEGRKVFVNKEICGYTSFSDLATEREELLQIFSALRREINQLDGNTAEELAIACNGLGFKKKDFIFAVHVFEELGLVAFADGKLTVYRGIKADLNNSSFYKKVCHLKTDKK